MNSRRAGRSTAQKTADQSSEKASSAGAHSAGQRPAATPTAITSKQAAASNQAAAPAAPKSPGSASSAAANPGVNHVSAAHLEASPRRLKQDVVLVTGPTEDGKGLNVLRAKDDTLQLGAVRPLEEGKPIVGEVVQLKQRQEASNLFDVETAFSSPLTSSKSATAMSSDSEKSARLTKAGPAQVATDSYRSGWDRIYKKRGKQLLN